MEAVSNAFVAAAGQVEATLVHFVGVDAAAPLSYAALCVLLAAAFIWSCSGRTKRVRPYGA
jgi:hypothetical protein